MNLLIIIDADQQSLSNISMFLQLKWYETMEITEQKVILTFDIIFFNKYYKIQKLNKICFM